jgi:hypothetical protein
MVLARTLLFIGLMLIALSSLWTSADTAVDDSFDAPFGCETCTGVEASLDVPLDPHSALSHFLSIAGDPTDPVAAHIIPGRSFSTRPALDSEIFAQQQPEPAQVLLRPPRLA